jgi:hypothetical protein
MRVSTEFNERIIKQLMTLLARHAAISVWSGARHVLIRPTIEREGAYAVEKGGVQKNRCRYVQVLQHGYCVRIERFESVIKG